MCVSCLGLLQYRGPNLMLAVAGGGAEDDSDGEDDEGHGEESPRICEREDNDHSNTFEHLPPRVHKGADKQNYDYSSFIQYKIEF